VYTVLIRFYEARHTNLVPQQSHSTFRREVPPS